MSNVYVTKEARSLRCDLTDHERLVKGRLLAESDADCFRIEEEKGQVAAQYAAQLKTATSRRHELASTIRQGYEFREVECRIERTYTEREVMVVREDTGEVIERRGMNPTELREAEKRAQPELFENETDAAAEPAKAEAAPVDTEKPHRKRGPRIQMIVPDETTDTPAQRPGEADAPATAHEDTGEAAAEPTPASEAASPTLDARDPGFETPTISEDGKAGETPCSTCDHYRYLHAPGDGACGLKVCRCDKFKPEIPADPDPLGLDDYDPEAQGEEPEAGHAAP